MALPFDEPQLLSGYAVPVKEIYTNSIDISYNIQFCFTFSNEKFADVLLLSSNADTGPGIPAHKLILSSCSHVRL